MKNTTHDDTFELYLLKVEIVGKQEDFVCSHKVGDYFLVDGENIIFEGCSSFSLYALSAVIALIPAKQRKTHKNDWMTTDAEVACPDPNCKARFRISRVAKKLFSHAETTVVPLVQKKHDTLD